MLKGYLIIPGLISAVALLGMLLIKDVDPGLAVENGLLEKTQVFLALAASGVFLAQRSRVGPRLHAILWAGFFFGLAFAFREVDVREMDDVPQWATLLGTGLGRDIIIGILWIGIFACIGRALYRLKWLVLRIPATKTGLILISAFIVMLVADAFERNLLGGETAQLFEEFLETYGYFLMLCAALIVPSLRSVEESAGPETSRLEPSLASAEMPESNAD